jgi:carboxymethylenebutenolidase
MGQMIELKASDGFTLAAYVAAPAGKARGALVVAQEIFGVNNHIKSVADGYAADGYLTIAPALFDRAQRGVNLGYSPADIEVGRAYIPKVSLDNAMLDVTAAIGHVAGAGKVGIVGYCWGGTVAWVAAAKASVACAIAYYGGGVAANVGLAPKAPVMFHWGETDHAIPMTDVRKIEAAHPGAISYVYPAGHGFNCNERGSWHEPSAKLARGRSLEFLAKHVG